MKHLLLRKNFIRFFYLILVFFTVSISFSYAQYKLPAGGPATENLVAGGTVEDDGGSGPYSPGYSGALTLVPTPGNVITLNFTAFDLEDGIDILYVYDGPNTSYPMIMCGTSGNTLPSDVVGTNSDGITILMQSDGTVEGTGFNANIIVTPGGVAPDPSKLSVPYYGKITYVGCTGTVYDGGGSTCNYPGGQGVADSDGFIVIEPSLADHVISLDFRSFDAEVLDSPPNPDFLRIFDGGDTLSPIIGDYSSLPGRIIVADAGNFSNPTGKLTLQFKSDYIFDFSGFEAIINCVPRPTIGFLTPDTTICLGDTAKMRVKFTGTPPFEFKYDDGHSVKTITGIATDTYKFDILNLPEGAQPVTLLSVGDKNLPIRDARGSDLVRIVTVLSPPRAQAEKPFYTVCRGNSVDINIILTGTPPFSLTYFDGVSNVTENNILSSPFKITLTPTNNVIFRFVKLSDARCQNGGFPNSVVLITVQNPPSATINSSGNGNVCPGGSKQIRVDLSGLAPYDLVYSDGTNNYTINNISTTPLLITVSPTQQTTYTLVSINNPSCPPGTVSGSATIGIFEPPVVDATAYVNCANGLGLITATGSSGLAPYQFSFDNGVTFQNINTASRPVRPQPYNVIIRDANGCKDTTSVLIPGLTAPDITDFTNITANSMRIQWSANLSPGVRYTLRYRVNGSEGDWTVISNLTINSRIIVGLQSATTYEFQVLVKCSNGLESDWSTLKTEKTLEATPATCDNGTLPAPVPTGIFVNQITINSARLNFNIINGPGYIIAYGLAAQNPNAWAQYVLCNQDDFITGAFYDLTNLRPNSIYRLRIRSNCTNCTTALKATDDRSNWSSITQFKTLSGKETEILNSELINSHSQITVYPNPNNGNFNIELPINYSGVVKINLLDILGREIMNLEKNITSDSNLVPINAENFPKGVYLLRIDQDGIINSQKICIE